MWVIVDKFYIKFKWFFYVESFFNNIAFHSFGERSYIDRTRQIQLLAY